MTDSSIPHLGTLDLAAPPYWRSQETAEQFLWTVNLALLLPLGAGLIFFGFRAAMVVAVALVTALAAMRLIEAIRDRPAPFGIAHTVMIGLLLGLLLPPEAPWYLPVSGALVAVVLASGLIGPVHYLLQPAVAARVLLQLFFWAPFIGPHRPVLMPSRLLIGDVLAARAGVPGVDWFTYSAGGSIDAVWIERPLSVLRHALVGGGELLSASSGEPMLKVISERLPPIGDAILGAVGGCIGQTSAVALIVAGLYLVYRGFARWQLPAFYLMAALLAAACLPLHLAAGPDGWQWWPLWAEGATVGLAYLSYQLVGGDLLIVAVILAADPICTPLTRRGAVAFAVVAGALGMVLSLYRVGSGGAMLALLLAYLLVPLIDRVSGRRVFGRG